MICEVLMDHGLATGKRVLQVLWTELAGPPAVFLREHPIFHELAASSNRGLPMDTSSEGNGPVDASSFLQGERIHSEPDEHQSSPDTGSRRRGFWA